MSTTPSGGPAGGRLWDALVNGRIESRLETEAIHALLNSNRLAADSMLRPTGQVEWKRLDHFPELAGVWNTHQEAVRKARYQEFAYWKSILVAIPIATGGAMWATIYDPMIETWSRYFDELWFVLARYLAIMVGAAAFMNWKHHCLVSQGYHWGFWRYSRAGIVGAVVGGLLLVTLTPPFLPFLPVLSHLLCGELMILTMVMIFRLAFERGFKADPG